MAPVYGSLARGRPTAPEPPNRPPTVANTPAAAGPEPGALAPWLLGLAFAVLALMASAVLASRNRAFRRRL